MKKNKQNGLHFTLGTFDEKKMKSYPITFCWKKSQVEQRANLILQKFGHCWLKVTYGKDLYNEGIYKTLKELKSALASFIEQPLMDYIGGK